MAKAFDSKKWEGHVEAARREGKAIRRYAAEHGLSAWSMYSARQQLIKRQGSTNTLWWICSSPTDVHVT